MTEQRRTGNPGNFAEDREKAPRAAHVGGQHSGGNFANDLERAAEAGRRGGEQSHCGGGASHNPGNFAQDRERVAETGRKGASTKGPRRNKCVISPIGRVYNVMAGAGPPSTTSLRYIAKSWMVRLRAP